MASYSTEVVAEQEARCYELRLTGATMRQIAAVVNISLATVESRLKAHMEKRVSPLAEEYRAVCIDRTERLLLKCEQGIQAGDMHAIQTASSLIDKLYKYNGLEQLNIQIKNITDAPTDATENVVAFYENLLLGSPPELEASNEST